GYVAVGVEFELVSLLGTAELLRKDTGIAFEVLGLYPHLNRKFGAIRKVEDVAQQHRPTRAIELYCKIPLHRTRHAKRISRWASIRAVVLAQLISCHRADSLAESPIADGRVHHDELAV